MRLHNDHVETYTYLSNVFIDEYMPNANGDYVKIYLYLLRCMQSGNSDLSISTISDHLDFTEGDVLRGFKYWEKEGLLSITRDTGGEITELSFRGTQSHQAPKPSITTSTNSYTTFELPKEPIPKATTALSQTDASYRKKDYTMAELSTLKKDSSYDTTLKVLEGYLGHPLNSKEIQTATFIYDELHFSTDLIYHLYEYCIDRGKIRPEYVEQVAISWAEANVRTPDDAENVSAAFNSDYKAVCKAFGLQRPLAKKEQDFIYHWVKELGFDTSIIVEACNRTILKIAKPGFEYANSILERWHKDGVHTVADIAKQDQIYKSKQANTATKPTTTNKFNQFPQRNYSKEQYSDLEKRLLQQSRQS